MSRSERLRIKFFQKMSLSQRGYDCLANAINYALRCPYFTTREQVVKVMTSESRYTYE
jgi:hypothetical protein